MIGKILMKVFWWLLVRGWIPDVLLRWKIRSGLTELLEKMDREGRDYQTRVRLEADFVREISAQPIAVHQSEANDQHYEIPAEFYQLCLGPKLKYSSCYFKDETTTLAEAEEEMLELYITRAGMKDGLALLDLGCGWGSVALHMAHRFPASQVTALSNSDSQRVFIADIAKKRGLNNLTVLTGDVAVYENEDFLNKFDRIISIEMFEHMKNYGALLKKISGWMSSRGKLFVHIFTHKWKPYHFKDDWMARTFFTGGTMPSHSLLLNFQADLVLSDQWGLSGTHYAKTLNIWLRKMDENIGIIRPILKSTYGDKWQRWLLNWRLFYLVCAETFGIRDGGEWGVSHYLFTKPG